ncbi:MAG: tetratricopeptide repeat protein [Thermodesulfobacteriaceae bacterium]|nr:tetratricopeptide repeat protein [Thermodesulfobacteriaceae bacterium]MCX8042270.1 tetratricopeptide repeat protein [Thermodesulfobacteriaceae bacterium]MDW8136508.1 tetratricopeptide repeat protein [Thermodesulfobacterium sp.]
MVKYRLILFLLVIFLFSCKADPKFYSHKTSSHKELAQLYLKDGRYTEALQELELAKKTDKCDAEVYNLLGIVYMAKKDYEKAEEYFKEALKINPSFSEAYNNYGSLKLSQGKYQEAITYFEKALSNPLYLNSHIAKANIGWAYHKLGDKEKAISYLISAIKDNPQYTKSLIYLGLLYLEDGNLDLAGFYLKRALRIDRNSGEARYYLGEVFFRKGQLDLAKELWQSIVFLAPDSEWAHQAEEKVYLVERIISNRGLN